ncbi:VWA domain-containing protein (plasmid) [Cereibacter azotoformans]|uniref:vWA domain-containing protein n=1 Tax=Cereibacter azotoformans TaxID=43057 RepID=UPI001EEC589D|nr:vWA domain-containing protein [Cereibacter azotoformans]ULB12089.1 VWA domain-containing protein [Cereibacter azotoformans]
MTLRLALLLLALALPSGAVAQPARPLTMEGMQTVYQRVLTRPGAPLQDAPGGAEIRRYPAFQPLYVFARQEGWLQVGPSAHAAPAGWVESARVVEWKQNIVAAFTNPADRRRSLIFESPEKLRWMMEHEALQDLQPQLIEKADTGLLAPADGVVSIEPANFVNIRDDLYLMPILDFSEELHPLNYEPNLLMKVASVPLEDELPAATREGPAGEFDAGVVFVLDTTKSMGPFIERTQRALSRVVNDLNGTETGARINFGVVAFRDNTAAVPGLEYRTKLLTPLARRFAQAPVLQSISEATNVAEASSPGFNEDSLAGVEDAVDSIDWDQDGRDPFDGRYIILVTDAGPKDPRDPNARSQIGPAEIQRDAEGRGIVIMTLHLKTASGAGNHDYAAEQYRKLSRFGQRQFYFPIEGGSEDEFEATVTTLVTALTDHVRAARGEASVLSPDEAGEDLVELGRAMRLAWLGQREGTQAPDVIEGWVTEKAAERPQARAIEPRLLITKNEMATMAELLDNLLRLAESTRGDADADSFFAQVQQVLAGMAQNPDMVVDASAGTLGGALEYLERLPYRSQLLQMDRETWAQSAMLRRPVIDGMRQKLTQYRKWLYDSSVWTALYEGAPDGETVFAMPFDVLP